MSKELHLINSSFNIKINRIRQEIIAMSKTIPVEERQEVLRGLEVEQNSRYFAEQFAAYWQLVHERDKALQEFNKVHLLEQERAAQLLIKITELFKMNKVMIKEHYKTLKTQNNLTDIDMLARKKLLGDNFRYFHLELWKKNILGIYYKIVYAIRYGINDDEEKKLPEQLAAKNAELSMMIAEYNQILRVQTKRLRGLSQDVSRHFFSDKLPIKDGREVLLSVKDIEISFGSGSRRFVAVNDVSFDIYKGETFGLVGESGSGKTTIGRAIVRINPVYSGSITYRGVDISKRMSNSVLAEMRKRIQMIYQDPAASLNERATVDYIVSEGLRAFKLFDNDVERKEKVEEAMRSVGLLPEHLRRYPHEFSGGQRQRIGIARSIVMRPEFIIADEPISALDVSIRAQVLNLLKSFQKEYDLTYLFIAHDLSVVRHIADRIAVISRGRIVELAPAETLFAHPLHDYTISLLSAIPQPDPELEKNKKLIKYEPRFYRDDEHVMFFEIEKGHFVLGTMDEIKRYKARLQRYDEISEKK